MIGLLGSPKAEVEKEGGLLEEGGSCPLATQDETINKGNRQKAILTANYGKSEGEQKCGNCEYFMTEGMNKCGVKKDQGLCEIFEFVCAASNVCDAWDTKEEMDESESEMDDSEMED